MSNFDDVSEDFPIQKKVKTLKEGEPSNQIGDNKSAGLKNANSLIYQSSSPLQQPVTIRKPSIREPIPTDFNDEDGEEDGEYSGRAQSAFLQAQNLKEDALAYYGKKEKVEMFERRNLKTIDLRNYHNWIKSVLIDKYMKLTTSNYRKQFKGFLSTSVLDVGCGTGGDLNKWKFNFISNYVGLDISEASLQIALDRWRKMKAQKKFPAQFIKMSGSSPEKEFYYHIPKETYFDFVSSQFVIHYMFTDEQSVRNLITNISKKMCQNAYFVCTIPDAEVIAKRLRTQGVKNQQGEYVIGNSFYSLKTKSLEFPKSKPFGVEYGFFLDEGAVGTKTQKEDGTVEITYVPEYFIMFSKFVELAAKFDLELVEDKNFHDFAMENIERKNYFELMKRIGMDNVGLIDPELWEVSHLYKVAVFKKKTGPKMNNVNRRFEFTSQGRLNLHTDILASQFSPEEFKEEKDNEDDYRAPRLTQKSSELWREKSTTSLKDSDKALALNRNQSALTNQSAEDLFD